MSWSGCSATSGSRLFISMRIAASWAQPLQLRWVPRGARTGSWIMSPSWRGGNEGDKQGGALLGSAPVQRVSVVGTSGSGKTTLAAALAARIGGSYSSKVRDLVWARADTVVWLDLPKRTVMRRIIWRSLWRAAGRVELWNGNRERWRNFFALDKEESVIVWAWQTHAVNRVKLEAAMADPGNSHLRFVRLTKPAVVRRFLR